MSVTRLLRPLFLVYQLCCSPFLSGQDMTPQHFRHSPLEFHRLLREAITDGQDVVPVIQTLIRETGDHSFSGLLKPVHRLRPLLLLEHQAWKKWNSGLYSQALELYQQAAGRLREIGAETESAFCFYYMAEILAEQERYLESAAYQELAFQNLPQQTCGYLEALLHQSRGYTVWFLDHLPASVISFGRALERWMQFEYSDPILSTWNNLAALYEELEMYGRAEHCYRKALQAVSHSTPAEMRLPLLLNFALFLEHRGETKEAQQTLLAAQPFQSAAPLQLELARAEILHDARALEELQIVQPSTRIESWLIRARWRRHENQLEQAQALARKALQESRAHSLHLQTRKAFRELGRILERQDRPQEAAELYRQAMEREELLARVESLFPYTRAVSPFLDGWVRSLVALGKIQAARRLLRGWGILRRNRAQKLLSSSAPIEDRPGELLRLVEAGRIDSPVTQQFSFPLSEPSSRSSVHTGEWTVLEFWPEEDQVFVWVDQEDRKSFHRLPLPPLFPDSLLEVLEPLYESSDRLLPAPSTVVLQEMYKVLFEPLEAEIRSPRVLIVPHKFLQVLPFELLVDRQGDYLLERFVFSYLPLPPDPVRPLSVQKTGGILLSPLSFGGPERSGAARERTVLPYLFPEMKVLESWEDKKPLEADWIHVSTHFRLDEQFWLRSGLELEQGEIPALQMLRKPIACNLLSLGVCDGANTFSAGTPYWLGLAELFLTNGARSMVVSRWQLDEISADIYLDFYRLCRQGRDLDEALTLARRRFKRRTLQRLGIQISAEHPFFWAGISFVGTPGYRLFLAADSERTEWFAWAALFLALALAARTFQQRPRN